MQRAREREMNEREEEKEEEEVGEFLLLHRDHTRSGYCLPCSQGDTLCQFPKGQGQVCLDANIPPFCLLKKR